MRAAAATLLAAVSMATATASAAVREEHVERPYTVDAQPEQTLRQALNAATPITTDGQRFHGHTRWDVRWTFRWWRETSGACRITEVTTRLRTEVQLPQLRRATPDQRALFDRYLRLYAGTAEVVHGLAESQRDAAHRDEAHRDGDR